MADLGPLQVERVPWSSLRPHPRNPRNGDVEAIAESVVVNGVYRPVYCAEDLTILAGHHLYQALGELASDEVDVIRLPINPDSPEATRIMLADNRTADLGLYDEGLLMELIRDLAATTIGIAGTGYTEDTIPGAIDPPNFDPDAESITIHGLTISDVALFRRNPGKDDTEKFLGLLKRH